MTAEAPVAGGVVHDLSTTELDDDHEDHREELRQRYYGLLQELRVVLPGVQVLLGFLLGVPFASRFVELDDLGRNLYGVCLVATAMAVAVLVAPATLHRFGDRRQRRRRLDLTVASMRVGLALLAVAIVSGVVVVVRFVFDGWASVVAGAAVATTVVMTWVVLPGALRAAGDEAEASGPGYQGEGHTGPGGMDGAATG